MRTVELKRRPEITGCAESLVVFDDWFSGQMTGEWYMVGQFGAVFPMRNLIQRYMFPADGSESMCMTLYALAGHDRKLHQTVKFYNAKQELKA